MGASAQGHQGGALPHLLGALLGGGHAGLFAMHGGGLPFHHDGEEEEDAEAAAAAARVSIDSLPTRKYNKVDT